METMDKGLTVVPKWVLIKRPQISQMPPNLSPQIVWLSPKIWDFDEKKASLGVRSVCHLTLHGLPFTKIWLRLLYSFEAKSLILFTIRQWICWVHRNIFLSRYLKPEKDYYFVLNYRNSWNQRQDDKTRQKLVTYEAAQLMCNSKLQMHTSIQITTSF